MMDFHSPMANRGLPKVQKSELQLNLLWDKTYERFLKNVVRLKILSLRTDSAWLPEPQF